MGGGGLLIWLVLTLQQTGIGCGCKRSYDGDGGCDCGVDLRCGICVPLRSEQNTLSFEMVIDSQLGYVKGRWLGWYSLIHSFAPVPCIPYRSIPLASSTND